MAIQTSATWPPIGGVAGSGGDTFAADKHAPCQAAVVYCSRQAAGAGSLAAVKPSERIWRSRQLVVCRQTQPDNQTGGQTDRQTAVNQSASLQLRSRLVHLLRSVARGGQLATVALTSSSSNYWPSLFVAHNSFGLWIYASEPKRLERHGLWSDVILAS